MIDEKLFGTDGIRAHVSAMPLLPENIARLGRILGCLVKEGRFRPGKPINRPHVVIGRDTRASGPYLLHALVSGLSAVGVHCHLLDVMPTAGVAFMTRATNAELGVMLSASHNHHHDNGLKIFDSDGFKISENLEDEIDRRIRNFNLAIHEIDVDPGDIIFNRESSSSYIAMLKSALPLTNLFGLKIALDSAHGAASQYAADMLTELGCEVFCVGEYAAGRNINSACGSEAPESIKAAVVNHRADLGIAFDGDADRVIFVDENGQSVDGDAVLALIAIELHKKNLLRRNTLAATVMSSVALDRALAPRGIEVIRTAVGDKLVAQKMRELDLSFGGENSGHLIMFPFSTTGDGILSALTFIAILHDARVKVSELMSFFKPTPKLIRNFTIRQKIPLHHLTKTTVAINQINDNLQANGRVMLRYSGTEKKARLLVEAQTYLDCENIADNIGKAFCDELDEHQKP